jgi:hypothetical protein
MNRAYKNIFLIVAIFLVFFSNTAYAEEPLILSSDNKEENNFELEAKRNSNKFADFFDVIVADTLSARQFDFTDIDSVKVNIVDFYKSKNKEVWYNIGSDESPIEQRKIIPLYKEISFIDISGNELIKYTKNGFSTNLKNVSDPKNTEYRSETYFEDAIGLGEGEVYIGKVATKYTFFEDVFKNNKKEDENKYEKVIARDIMKQGVIRFSTPFYRGGKLFGVIVLSLDYRHFQELAKHVEPGNNNEVISASYAGNYILVFDIDGNTVIHPKPNNIRGYLPDGTLAGYNETNPKNEGSIFNLYAYDKSLSYRDMAEKILKEKEVYTASATDVSGRTKLTVAVPIIYNNPKTNYKDIGVIGGLMMSVSLEEKKAEIYEELLIKLKALQVTDQINDYLKKNPELSIKDLQGDDVFREIAVQPVGETGYTALMDSQSGYFYFHPQERLINTNSADLKNDLPDWWKIFDNTIGDKCQESSGYYKWKEADGSVTDKFLYTTCVEEKTADGKSLFVGATNYLKEEDAKKYLDKYEIKKDFLYAKEAIKQKAEDVARQVEIYLNINNGKTVPDLQADEYFQKIAVQKVGQTGYTAVTDYDSLIARFHSNPKIVNLDLSNLAEKLPGFWNIMKQAKGGQAVEGIYDWEEADGSIKKKYMYIAVVGVKTADGVGFNVAATTYLDEYENIDFDSIDEKKTSQNVPAKKITPIDYSRYIYWFSAIALIIFLIIFILNRLNIIRFEKNSGIYLLVAAIFFIIILFVLNTWLTTSSIRVQSINSLTNYMLALSTSQEIQINNYIDDQVEKINLLGLNENINNEDLKKTLSNNTDFKDIFVIDTKGIIIYSSDESHLGQDCSREAYFINSRYKEYIGPIKQENTSEGILFVVSVPFKGGIIAANIGIDFFKNLTNNYLGLGDTEEILYAYRDINGNAYFITNRKFKENSSNIVPKENQENSITQALLNNEDVFSGYKDYRAVPVIAATRYIELLDLGMVIKIDQEEAMAPVMNSIRKVWFFTSGMIFFIILIGLFISHLLTKSLRIEVINKTLEIEKSANLLKEELRKEKKIIEEKEKLNIEQKKVKMELENKIIEMEKFQDLTIGRELKMVELKEKIKQLEKNKKNKI